jgi:hypothetical protein
VSVQDTENVNGRSRSGSRTSTDGPAHGGGLVREVQHGVRVGGDPPEVASALEFDGFGDNAV